MQVLLDKTERELRRVYGLKSVSLGLREIFKSAPEAVAIPTELLDWIRLILEEGLKTDIAWESIQYLIRTKAVEKGYSSQQVYNTMERAIIEYNSKYSDATTNKTYEKLNN